MTATPEGVSGLVSAELGKSGATGYVRGSNPWDRIAPEVTVGVQVPLVAPKRWRWPWRRRG